MRSGVCHDWFGTDVASGPGKSKLKIALSMGLVDCSLLPLATEPEGFHLFYDLDSHETHPKKSLIIRSSVNTYMI